MMSSGMEVPVVHATRPTSGPKGFMVPAWMHAERDAIYDIVNVDGVTEHNRFGWAVANKPGTNVINGGRSRMIALRARLMREQVEKDLGRKRSHGRHTPKGVLALQRPADV